MAWHRRAAALLHRRIWQRLPRGLRRAALLHSASVLAPRPTPHAASEQPLFVAGYFRTASGLGQSARLCHDACRRLGLETQAIDLSAEQMQPADLPLAAVDARGHRGPGTVILHVNAPLVPPALMQLGRSFVRHKHIIGYWAWELECAPDDWRHGIPFVHQAWVPSRFTAEAVRRRAPDLPIRVVPHPLAAPVLADPPARRDGRFRVLLIFNAASSFARKNPGAGIAAFRKAFAHDNAAELIVKSSNLDAYPEARRLLDAAIGGQTNIRHVADVLAPSDLDALYAGADAVLSLHRSEGFGLVPAEAMLRGLPVVATDWSGTTDFLTTRNACPVRYRLVPARDPQGVYDFPQLNWADADIDHAAEMLQRLRSDADWRMRIGRHAAEDAARLFSLDAYGTVMQKALAGPPPH